MDLPVRKRTRLKGYDYSHKGMYFITICTHERRCILSRIVGDGDRDVPKIELTEYGKIIEKYIISSNRIENIIIDRYVIMPNHIHLIVYVGRKMNEVNGTSRAPSPTDFLF